MISFSTLFFDLDDTLYPPSSGLWQAIAKRIDLYIRKRLGMPWDQISAYRHFLFKTYGTTMRGLIDLYNIDKEDYLGFVHDLPLEDYLLADPTVRLMVQNLTQRKVIFTNADANHARRVLKVLNLDDCFDEIIDILAVDPHCKPQRQAFQIALHHVGEIDAQRCVLIDDSVPNLQIAESMGFFTVRAGYGDTIQYLNTFTHLTELPHILAQAESKYQVEDA